MLYVDVGGSYLKIMYNDQVERWEMDTNKIIHLDPIKEIIKAKLLENPEIEEAAFSCQMHGFALKEIPHEFFTWKNKGIVPKFIEAQDFLHRTGMYLRDDLAICILYKFLTENPEYHNRDLHIQQISEALLDLREGHCSEQMLASMGFYDINSKFIIDEYVDEFKKSFNVILHFDEIGEIGGFFIFGDRKVTAHVGYGDMQCSLLGINLKENQTCINLATGSQIAKIAPEPSTHLETRLFFGKYLHCVTHIPSGRVLLMFQNFIPNLFELINELDLNIDENLPDIDLGSFYDKGIAISKLHEHNSSPTKIVTSLFNEYICQYINLIDFFHNPELVLSGGISKKIPLIKKVFEKYYQDVKVASTDDDSLWGLKILYKDIITKNESR